MVIPQNETHLFITSDNSKKYYMADINYKTMEGEQTIYIF